MVFQAPHVSVCQPSVCLSVSNSSDWCVATSHRTGGGAGEVSELRLMARQLGDPSTLYLIKGVVGPYPEFLHERKLS